MAQLRVLVAYPNEGMYGSTYHRLCVPSRALKAMGVDVTQCDDILTIPESDLTRYDAIIVHNSITRKTINPKIAKPLLLIAQAIKRVRQSGIAVILDLDDTWNLPPVHPHYHLWKQTCQATAVLLSIGNADLVWCSTEPLLRDVQRFDRTARLVPNGINLLCDPQWQKLDKIPDPELRFGLTLNETHWHNAKRLNAAFQRLNGIPGWRLVVTGFEYSAKQMERVVNLLGTDRITFTPYRPVHSYADFYRHIDVLLCPLTNTAFNGYRSDIKLAECAFSGTAAVCDFHGPYRGTKHSIATNSSWKETMPKLVRDPERLVKDYIPNPSRYTTYESDRVRLATLTELIKGRK